MTWDDLPERMKRYVIAMLDVAKKQALVLNERERAAALDLALEKLQKL